MKSPYRPLLGRLAANGWFNEVIATDALRLVLDDPAIRTAFLAHVGGRASVDLAAVRTFERERVTFDGRIDLEGVDTQGRPRLIIEAKFGHTMSVEQMARYRTHQRDELTGVDAGVLLLLVPAGRLPEAEAIMSHLASAPSAAQSSSPTIVPIALSWERCLDAIELSLHENSLGGPISPAADVAQLRSVCETLAGWSTPLGEIPDSQKSEHLRVVLNQLKGRVPSRHIGRLEKDRIYSVFRYFAVPGAPSWYAIGLAQVGGENSTPMWLRFHKATNGFAEVKRSVRRSSFAESVIELDGHLWIPLQVPEDLTSPELVELLVGEVEAILCEVFPGATEPPPPTIQGPDQLLQPEL